MPTSRPNIPALTSLRFFAALAVVFFHYDSKLLLFPSGVLRSLSEFGHQSVAFFFILSGFILTYVHAGSSATQPALNVGTADFLAARAARILPAYYLALILAAPFFFYSCFVAKLISLPLLVAGLIFVSLLIQAWYPPTALLWNVPAWSLSVEFFFYAIYPALFRASARISTGRFLAIAYAGVVIVTSLLKGYLDGDPSASTNWHIFLAYSPVFHLPLFIWGVALGRYYVFSSKLSATAHELMFAAGTTALGAVFLFRENAPWLLDSGCLAIVFGAIIFGGAGASGIIARLLSISPLVWLGDASYAIYITHVPVAQWWRWISRKYFMLDLAPGTNLVGQMSCVICCSLVVFIYVETPTRKWLMSRYRSRIKVRIHGDSAAPTQVQPSTP